MKMLIGLTGKTGSGKSSASKIFEKLGAFTVDCDEVAHEVLLDNNIKEALCALFTHNILDGLGEIDRKKLGAIVFADKESLAKLNGVVHPAIVNKCIEQCTCSGKDICIMDGSELESSGADKKCDHIVVIVADDEVRLRRIMVRDSIDRESALRRMASQKDYGGNAIFVTNDKNEEQLEKEITKLYNKFLGELNA